MSGLLKGSAAIVTGSSRGIGAAVARAFAAQGADLIIHGTNEALLEGQAAEICRAGVRCNIVAGDIGNFQTAQRLTDACLSAYGRIDILVNNAGVNSRYPFGELPLEEWDAMLRVNLTGAFYTCKCVIPQMLKQKKGCIVNVSSLAGKTAHANASICYGVSKAGLNSLTQKLAYDYASQGIRVNAVCPGPVETDMSSQWDESYREKVFSGVPLGRLGKVSEVADAVVFLASEMSSFITGESINVNGGKYMN